MSVANGTVALQLAVAALGLPEGAEIVMPSFTIISCATAAVYCGAKPVLVDADPVTWCMDVEQLADAVSPRTRAIMPVHIYGHPVDLDPVLELARERGVAVIEDAAEAHGAEYRSDGRWRRCGGFGDVSCFSFYANKLVTTGEGGMLVTDDDALAERARSLRNLAFRPDRRFLHEELGFNYRLTNLQAALGLAQVERIDEIVERKRRLGAAYAERLGAIPGLELAQEQPWARSVWWMFGVVVHEETGLDAQAFAERLRERGVDTRPFFLGLHEQPVLQRLGLLDGRGFPVTERIARQGLYLPSGLALTDAQLDEVVGAVQDVLR